ncbi:MAG: 50S ribosomal protein L5 [Elusimicrobia bacterium]|nr:50S ribosomal protein L5 [Elusimicrobiota bacterium]
MAEKEKEKEKAKQQQKPAAKQQKPAQKGEAKPKAAPVKAVIEKPAEAPRLKRRFFDEIVPAMMDERGYENVFEVPRLKKIVINMGVSEAKENIQALDAARDDLIVIAGQMPQVRRAKKSISNFKLREGMPIGLRVTLRGDRMYEFIDRLIAMAVPRIRDFRGLEPRGFDGRGNYNLGLREQLIFPEINLEKVGKTRGMNVTFVTSAKSDEEGFDLLDKLGMPFKRPAKQAKEAKPA